MVLIEAEKTQRLKLIGEDTSYLLCMIESSFGVKFTEDEFVEAKTIGKLAESIFSKLEHPLSEKCLTAVVFYQLRRTFVRLFDISREDYSGNAPARTHALEGSQKTMEPNTGALKGRSSGTEMAFVVGGFVTNRCYLGLRAGMDTTGILRWLRFGPPYGFGWSLSFGLFT